MRRFTTRIILTLAAASVSTLLLHTSPTMANQNPENSSAVPVETIGAIPPQCEYPQECPIEPVVPSDTKPPRPIIVPGDADLDGIQDLLEDTLASQFMPWVWFDSGENYGRQCTHPATHEGPGTVVARVRRHPSDWNKIAITYAVLYRKDCGDFLSPWHRGDIEPFTMTLAPNPTCPLGYGAFSIKTTAHQGTISESREQAYLGNVCQWGRQSSSDAYTARIFASENKHGNYLTLDGCDRGGFLGSDHCSFGFTLDFRVFNVGEDHARRIDLMNWTHGFPEEYVWSRVEFCGTLGHQYGHCGAGYVRDKLLSDALLAPAF